VVFDVVEGCYPSKAKVSILQMVECSAATLSYALGIRVSKNYKGSEIQRLRALRL